MEHRLVFIGSQFRHNEIFYEYILRSAKKALHTIDVINFYDDNDKRLFLELESMLEGDLKLLLVCSKANFSLVGKLLSTVTGDNQVVKDDMLVPSQIKENIPNSYLVDIGNVTVNVVLAEVEKELPSFLFEDILHTTTLHVFEENIEDIKLLLSPLADSLDITFKITMLISGWHIVKVSSAKYGETTSFANAILSLLPNKVIVTTNIMAHIIERLSSNNMKITTAESCTGGQIASMLTKESGSSKVFDGGIITYSNEKKNQWLGVDEEILDTYGAVSEQTVLAMSKGAKDVADADFALSVSGIAGPTGGTQEKPVGLVYLSICTAKRHETVKLLLAGDREYIQNQVLYNAFKLLILTEQTIFF